jgi:hypothetical protein
MQRRRKKYLINRNWIMHRNEIILNKQNLIVQRNEGILNKQELDYAWGRKRYPIIRHRFIQRGRK